MSGRLQAVSLIIRRPLKGSPGLKLEVPFGGLGEAIHRTPPRYDWKVCPGGPFESFSIEICIWRVRYNLKMFIGYAEKLLSCATYCTF